MKKKINGLVEFFSVFVFFLPLFFNELTRVRSEICRDRMRATGGTTAREPARTSTSDRIKPVPHHFFFGFLYFFFHLHYFSFVYPPSSRPLDFWCGGFFFFLLISLQFVAFFLFLKPEISTSRLPVGIRESVVHGFTGFSSGLRWDFFFRSLVFFPLIFEGFLMFPLIFNTIIIFYKRGS